MYTEKCIQGETLGKETLASQKIPNFVRINFIKG